MITLFDHNLEIYEEFENTLKENNKAIFVAATGTGKSYVCAKFLESHPGRSLIICPKLSICQNWRKLLSEEETDIMTYQGFNRLTIDNLKGLPYKYVIFDEAHHIGSPEWQKNIRWIMENRSDITFIGLSADPRRYSDGGKDVSMDFFGGKVIYGLNVEEAISACVLPSFTYVSALFTLEEYLRLLKIDAEKAVTNIPLIKEKIDKLEYNVHNTYKIETILKKHMPEGPRKTLVFVDEIGNIPSAMDSIRPICKEGVFFDSIHAYKGKEKNLELIREFEEEEEGFLFSVDMLNEGVHIHGVNTIIMMRRTQSPSVYFQQLGRVLSSGNDNGEVIIFDFVGNHSGLDYETTSQGNRRFLKALEKDREKTKGVDVILIDYIRDTLDLVSEIREYIFGKWSEEEDNILKEHYASDGPKKCCAYLPQRTGRAIQVRAKLLGICKERGSANPWTAEEIEMLKTYYPIEGISVSKRIGRSETACKNMAIRLGFKHRNTWTPEEDAILKEYYPLEGNSCAERIDGRTKDQCSKRALKLGIKKTTSNNWTAEEDAIIKEYYPDEGKMVAERLPGRNMQGIRTRANKLGVKKNSNAWTEEEDDIIRKYYPTESGDVSLRLEGRTASACSQRARFLGIKGTKNNKRLWTAEEDELLRAYYPTEGMNVSSRLNGRTMSACKNRAQRLGIELYVKDNEQNIGD